ncbi:hypothetical protein COCCADRAFT_104532, partial [Bipolaris zeicola 26-R-13]
YFAARHFAERPSPKTTTIKLRSGVRCGDSPLPPLAVTSSFASVRDCSQVSPKPHTGLIRTEPDIDRGIRLDSAIPCPDTLLHSYVKSRLARLPATISACMVCRSVPPWIRTHHLGRRISCIRKPVPSMNAVLFKPLSRRNSKLGLGVMLTSVENTEEKSPVMHELRIGKNMVGMCKCVCAIQLLHRIDQLSTLPEEFPAIPSSACVISCIALQS